MRAPEFESRSMPMPTFPEPFATLINEHRTIESVVADALSAVNAARGHADDTELTAATLETMRDLEAFMDVDLTVHIAKEEHILFPAFRVMSAENAVVVTDMLAQHDEVRDRHLALQETLALLDHAHGEVEAERRALSSELAGVVTNESLSTLGQIVRRLDAILQGHFYDEEDGLFEPAASLFDSERLLELHAQMEKIGIATLD